MHRSFDANIMKEAAGEFNGPNFPYQDWVNNHKHIMLVDGDDVGLATFEYDGVYTVHWFFVSRGKRALELAKQMRDDMFDIYGAKVLRGLTPMSLPAARWMARQVGFKSYGIEEWPDGPYEIIMMTKDER